MPRNVADAATPPPQDSVRRGRQIVWTGEQLGRFLQFVADSPYLPAWLFLATSGSRRGEVLGLRWDDLDLNAPTAVMSRQVTMVDHRVVVKELPKTKVGHTIAKPSSHRQCDGKRPPATWKRPFEPSRCQCVSHAGDDKPMTSGRFRPPDSRQERR